MDDADRAGELIAKSDAAALKKRKLMSSVSPTALTVGLRGRCVACKDKIEEARLQANPQAVRCILCQEELERK